MCMARPKVGLLALGSLLAAACGAKGAGPGQPDAGGGDASPAQTDATADLSAAASDTGADAPVTKDGHADVVTRETIPTLADAAFVGPCGAGTAVACPATYLGTSAILGPSSGAAALAPDDSLYLGGSFDEATDFDPTAGTDLRAPAEFRDAFITRLGPAATYGATVTFTGFDQWGTNISSLSAGAGSAVAVGTFTTSIDLDPGPGMDTRETHEPGGGESFALMLSATGAPLWARTFQVSDEGSAGFDRGAAAADGTTYLVGSYRGRADLDPGPSTTRFASDAKGVSVTRLDQAGDLLWVRTIGGPDCQARDLGFIALAPDGAPWILMPFQGACAFDGPDQAKLRTPLVETGMFVASLTTAGQARGLFTLGASFDPTSLAVAADGSVYLGGVVGSSLAGQDQAVDFDPSAGVATRAIPHSNGTSFVLKLDPLGGFQWVQLYPDPLRVSALAGLADGGVLVAGGPQRTFPVGMSIIRLGADQREAWRILAGGAGTVPTALMASAKGFVVAGYQDGQGDLDPSSGVDRFLGRLTFVSRYAF
jgi:hypothetical protein